MRQRLIIVRGGGDIATGTIHKLHQSGFAVLVLETACPSAIRRQVAFSEAVYDGVQEIEGVCCERGADMAQVQDILAAGNVAVLVDPKGEAINRMQPFAVVDAILAKKNLGTSRDMAPLTVALGPGFCAGADVDVVVETMRGHKLGRLIYEGKAIPDTGIPGEIAGVGKARVMHAQAEGILRGVKKIGDYVKEGEQVAVIESADGICPVAASVTGIVRGLIRDGYPVTPGFKIADIDPRREEYENCFTISDKARCIAGGVLEAVMHHMSGEDGGI